MKRLFTILNLLVITTLFLPLLARAQAPDTACSAPSSVVLSNVTATSATISWQLSANIVSYELEYSLRGSPPNRSANTTSASITLVNLLPRSIYEVHLRARCSNGQTSIPDTIIIYTLCNNADNNVIAYWDLHSPSVKCYYGVRGSAWNEGIIDTGNFSHHTVLSDTTERDIFTLNQLRTIPEGYCYSVRLGNRNVGSERDKIVYNIHVDTNKLALLLLRFAIVEANPNHNPQQQPYFTFSVTNSQGRLYDSCLYANFVAGDNSGWNVGGSESIVWHDWTSIGVNLTPYHGQNLQVHVEAADCAHGAHFGYAYFVLDAQTKQITSSTCGESVENVFVAPEGFTYRWYNANNPSDTLSISRFLHVTQFGTYCCRMNYSFSNRNCGFTLTARATPRYPVARFSMSPVNNCTPKISFRNHSVVATDSALTHLTNEPCESFLWLFDDGETSTEVNPTHLFHGEGLHWARLTAMLANGTCSNSVTDSFTLHYDMLDDFSDTICPGIPYLFHDTVIRDSGSYNIIDNCGFHHLKLSYHHSPNSIHFDTICAGDTLRHSGSIFTDSGSYIILFPGTALPNGCDSVERVNLTVHPSYFLRISDTLPLGDYYTLGTKQIQAPGVGGYTFQSVDGCDSTIWLRLSCINIMDTTVCEDNLPVLWDGVTYTEEQSDTSYFRSHVLTDSIIVHSLHLRPQASPRLSTISYCDTPQHYVVTLIPEDYTYQWSTLPPIQPDLQEFIDSLFVLHFRPLEETQLHFLFDYSDAPSCPSSTSLTLFPQRFFYLDLDVQPETLTSDHLHLVVRDRSANLHFRQWMVDSVLQNETGARLEYDVSPIADSVVVTLIGVTAYVLTLPGRLFPSSRKTFSFPMYSRQETMPITASASLASSWRCLNYGFTTAAECWCSILPSAMRVGMAHGTAYPASRESMPTYAVTPCGMG